jgi:hypothetical protein
MNWRARFAHLLGAPAPRRTAERRAAKPSESRAELIAAAREIQRTHGRAVRAVLQSSIDALQKDGAKTLRDPDAVARLMGLIHAQRVMHGLMRGDLKRYLVLTGLRQLLGQDAAPPPKSPPGKSPPVKTPPKARVVRRST